MRLPRSRRLAVTLAGLPVAAAALAGCKGPGLADTQYLMVQFTLRDSVSSTVHQRVLDACGSLPGAHPLPLSKTQGQVIFDVTKATPTEQDNLDVCLHKQPGVTSVSVQNSDDGD